MYPSQWQGVKPGDKTRAFLFTLVMCMLVTMSETEEATTQPCLCLSKCFLKWEQVVIKHTSSNRQIWSRVIFFFSCNPKS